jgi:hypothetical protein
MSTATSETPTVGERVLHGQRVNGIVRVTDSPAVGNVRAFLVERGLEEDGNAALKRSSPTISLRRSRADKCRCCDGSSEADGLSPQNLRNNPDRSARSRSFSFN